MDRLTCDLIDSALANDTEAIIQLLRNNFSQIHITEFIIDEFVKHGNIAVLQAFLCKGVNLTNNIDSKISLADKYDHGKMRQWLEETKIVASYFL